ncbi:MAG: hypothetical protein E7508_10505 [Ruminococcus sp.]|nr:hypothetical protein [Ruminococcus sp.]
MIKKLTAIFAALTIALCLCGCDYEDYPSAFSEQLYMIKKYNQYDFEVKYTDNDIIDKCFEEITAGPLVLSLPMNASDLPDDVTLEFDKYYEHTNSYNGFRTVLTDILIGENDIGNATVLCKNDDDFNNGTIVALTIYSTYVNASAGDWSLDMTFDEIDTIMGFDGNGGNKYIYSSSDGKSVYFSNFYDGVEYPDAVCISTIPELCAYHLLY